VDDNGSKSEAVRVEKVTKVFHDNGVPVYARRGIDLSIFEQDFSVIDGTAESRRQTTSVFSSHDPQVIELARPPQILKDGQVVTDRIDK
jgi:hypothetical protein